MTRRRVRRLQEAVMGPRSRLENCSTLDELRARAEQFSDAELLHELDIAARELAESLSDDELLAEIERERARLARLPQQGAR